MPFQSLENLAKPRIGQAMSLGRGHIDPATLVLTFHYQENQQNGGTWSTVDLEQELTEGTHYSLNARDGQITLLPHAFWQSESTWRAGDRVEPLLYKGRVKHPQRIDAAFEYYEPEPVTMLKDLTPLGASGRKALVNRAGAAILLDLDTPSSEAQARLGYSVPQFAEAIPDG
jgi:hypothetical protein